MSLLLKKLNQASAQKAADDDAEKAAASAQEGAQTQQADDGTKPAAPQTPPVTQTPPTPATSATPPPPTHASPVSPAPVSAAAQPATPPPATAPAAPGGIAIKQRAQPATPTEPTMAKPAQPAQPAPALKTAPPAATATPAGVRPAATAPATAPATASVAPAPITQPVQKPAEVQLTSAATEAAEAVASKRQVKPRARDLPASLRTTNYFNRARGGIASAARVLSAQTGDGGSKKPKVLVAAAVVIVVGIGGFYGYSQLTTSSFDGGGSASAPTVQRGDVAEESVVVSALPSPAVDVQAQIAGMGAVPQEQEDAVVVTVSGEDAIESYEIVPSVQYSDEEWSLIEREEREAVEAEQKAIALIAASDLTDAGDGEEFAIQAEGIDVPDENISVRADTAKVERRAEIKTSDQAVHRATKLSQAADLYAAGRYERAGRVYGEVLSDTPANLQALRGSALVATAMRRYQKAADFYVQILEYFPDDPFAVAELANLGGINPSAVEQLLTRLLGKTPAIDGRLYFALGNVYAASSRWRKARDAFGDALSREKNPDYAYNLAIALEYLRKPQLAVFYYRQALQMAQGAATAGFDADKVRSRIAVLDA